MDRAFLSTVDSLVSRGEGDSKLVCVIRYDAGDWELARGKDIERLEHLGGRSWIVRAPATAAQKMGRHPRVVWIGEYRSEYKYNRALPGAKVVWVYVESFRGDRAEFRRDLKSLGISKIRYFAPPGLYYARAQGDHIEGLASLWWVKNIYRAHRRGMAR
ncbi:MAG: hypothetical protein OEN01_10130 [Candidatus Krumholzibacteria bacterium]|nr:hypothetical protein [Candidatus Krumholzibacteria bacterium]